MAKAKPAAAAANAPAAGKAVKKINRTRRNALERKSLPKSLKMLFAGSDRATFRSLLVAWQESRRRTMTGERASKSSDE